MAALGQQGRQTGADRIAIRIVGIQHIAIRHAKTRQRPGARAHDADLDRRIRRKQRPRRQTIVPSASPEAISCLRFKGMRLTLMLVLVISLSLWFPWPLPIFRSDSAAARRMP